MMKLISCNVLVALMASSLFAKEIASFKMNPSSESSPHDTLIISEENGEIISEVLDADAKVILYGDYEHKVPAWGCNEYIVCEFCCGLKLIATAKKRKNGEPGLNVVYDYQIIQVDGGPESIVEKGTLGKNSHPKN